MWRAALLLVALPCFADEAIYPAAQCAAFWDGFGDAAESLRFLDADPGVAARADAFRAVAYRLSGGKKADIDRKIAEQRPLMALLVEAYVLDADRQSRDIFQRLSQTCEAFGAQQPEIRDLP